MFKLKLSILIVFLVFSVGMASAGNTIGNGFVKECDGTTCAYTVRTTYQIWNGTYQQQPIQQVEVINGGYRFVWNGGGMNLTWDGTYDYDEIFNPDNGTLISPWARWHVESWKTTGQGTWQEEIPVSHTFVRIDNNTVRRVMTLGSGGKFNITYTNLGYKIKYDLDLTAGYNRKYRIKYRVDSVAGQDINLGTRKYTPGWFNNFTVWDWIDVPQWREFEGTWISGFATYEEIEPSNQRYYFIIDTNRTLNISERIYIDPSWTVGGGGEAWAGNATFLNASKDLSGDTVAVGEMFDSFNDDTATQYTLVLEGGKSASYSVVDGLFKFQSDSNQNMAVYYYYPLNLSNGTIVTRANQTQDGQGYGHGVKYNGSSWYTHMHWGGTLTGYKIWDKCYYSVGFSYCLGEPDSSSWAEDAEFRIWRTTLSGADMYGWIGEVASVSGTTAANIQGAHPWGMMVTDGNSQAANSPNFVDWIRIMSVDDSGNTISTGNLTTWYDSGSGYEVYQVYTNVTTPANTNYTVWYANNGSSFAQVGGTYTGNQTISLSPAYQNTDVRVRLEGNISQSPELISITFWTQTASEPTSILMEKYQIIII